MKTVTEYQTIGGAVVEVTAISPIITLLTDRPGFEWRCGGCRETGPGWHDRSGKWVRRTDRDGAHNGANSHAAGCRAMPRRV